MKVGDVIIVQCPADGCEPETWLRGKIVETVSTCKVNGSSLHVVRVQNFKWDWSDPWGEYDGIPKVLVRETPGKRFAEWEDRWPRRAA